MSRYNSYNDGSTGGNNSGNGNDFDDKILKLQKYSALKVTGQRVNAFDSQYGDKFVVGFDEVKVLDGIVFRREDKPDTYKVFSPGKFFDVDEDTGLVLDGNGDAMAAQDILEHPRVLGFSETFGGEDYFYTPVGVVVEAADDVAVNSDIDVETDGTSIVIGEVSMLLSNKAWTRTLAKLLTDEGDSIIAQTEDEQGNLRNVTESHGWLTTMDPTLREGIEGRVMELFIIEETQTFMEDGDEKEVTYTTPILLDAKTGGRITIDNADPDAPADEGDEAEAEVESAESDDAEQESDEADAEAEPAVADGGAAAAESQNAAETIADSVSDASESDDSDDSAAWDGPKVLDDLLDYFARTDGEVDPDELREFAEDEVDDADAVDWQAASEEVTRRFEAGDF